MSPQTQSSVGMLDLLASAFEEKLRAASTPAAVLETAQQTTLSLGCTAFAFATFDLQAPEPSVARTISTFPPGWRQRYREQNFVARDPVIWACAEGITPVRWQNLKSRTAWPGDDVSDPVREIFDEADSFGLKDGLAVPIHYRGEQMSIFSVVTDLSGRNGTKLFDAFQHTFHAMAIVFFEFFNRSNVKNIFASPSTRLNT